jgi:DsbC/DsbD-like thiol-disulfide interchange protein
MMRRISLLLAAGLILTGLSSNAQAQDAKARRSDSVVKINVEAGKPESDGKQVLTVTFKIDDSWHIYANSLPQDFPGVPTSIKLSAQGKIEDIKVDYPEGKWIKEADYKAYLGTIPIKVKYRRSKGDDSPLEVTVSFQACTKTSCLFPVTVKEKIENRK